MKHLPIILCVVALLFSVGCRSVPKPQTAKATFSSFDLPADHPDGEVLPAGAINFQNVDVSQVLEIYAELAKRTVVRGALPNASITLRTASPVGRVGALQLLDTVLAQNGIVMIYTGDKAVKAVPAAQAPSECAPEIDLPWPELPDSSSYMTRTVHLQNLKAVDAVSVLQPFASRLPGTIVVLQQENLLILRDYASNIKAELRFLDELEKARAR